MSLTGLHVLTEISLWAGAQYDGMEFLFQIIPGYSKNKKKFFYEKSKFEFDANPDGYRNLFRQ